MTTPNQAAGAPDSRQFLGHPIGLSTLFFTEMWERFTYYGMRALLVLFLVDAVAKGGFGLDDKSAAAIYGLYTAAAYILALPGGWIADRLIGAQAAVLVGGIVITIGNVMLAIPGSPALFYSGLGVIAIGVGLLKPNVSAVVADLYPEGGARRDAGFSLFYMGINIGGLLGPFIAGWLALHYGWRVGYWAAAIGMALGVLQFWLTRKRLGDAGLKPHRAADANVGRDWLFAGLFGAGLALLALLLLTGVLTIDPRELSEKGTAVLVTVAVAYFGYVLFFAGLTMEERKRVAVIMVLCVACTLFWSGFEQAGTSLNLFAERYTDRMLGTWEIPTTWFQSINSVFIIIFAPLFSMLWLALGRRNVDVAAPAQFGSGLILMGLGFLVMVGASKVVGGGELASANWLVMTYLLHTFGELALSPVGLSTLTKLSPKRFVGQMMGAWFLATSLGNLVAGLIAGDVSDVGVDGMPDQFFSIFVFGAGAGLVLLVLSGPLKRLMGGVR